MRWSSIIGQQINVGTQDGTQEAGALKSEKSTNDSAITIMPTMSHNVALAELPMYRCADGSSS